MRRCFLPRSEQRAPFPLSGSLMQGPARPKHPDAEKLFPYQSGNTAPPPHPLYKKHDSSIPKKKNAGRPARLQDLKKSPPNSFCQKKKISRKTGVGEGGRGEGVKESSRPRDFFYFCPDYEKGLPQQDRRGVEGWGWKGCRRMAPRIRARGNKGERRWRRAETAAPVLH